MEPRDKTEKNEVFMRYLKWFGALVVIAGVIAGVMAFTSPTYGQVVAVHPGNPGDPGDDDQRPMPRARALEILGGRGSEIGAAVRDVDQADVKREKLSAETGAVIDEVRSDGPASKAGLKAGDVVVEFDGERVRSARHLTRLVQETPAGRTVKAAAVRDGKRVDLQIRPETGAGLAIATGPFEHGLRRLERLGDNLRFDMPSLRDFDFHVRMRPGRLGVGLQDLGDQLADYFGVKDGVLVTSVSDGSAAAKAGLKAGDVITSLNGRSVRGANDVRRELLDVDEGKEFPIVVVREKKELTLKVTLEPMVERARRRPLRGI